jgi:hypothetical protein
VEAGRFCLHLASGQWSPQGGECPTRGLATCCHENLAGTIPGVQTLTVARAGVVCAASPTQPSPAQPSTAQHSAAQQSKAKHSKAKHSTAGCVLLSLLCPEVVSHGCVPQVFKHAAMCVLEHPRMIPAMTDTCACPLMLVQLQLMTSPSPPPTHPPTHPPTPPSSAGCKPARGYYRIRNRVQCKPCVGETWSPGGITPCKPCKCDAVTECTTATCDVAVGCIYYKKRDGTPCTVGGAAGSCTDGVCTTSEKPCRYTGWHQHQ